jgi:hypothetical protein
MSTGLGREDIRALLDDLSTELAARGARAELFLVGGAALAVAYDAMRATRDLDAVFIPTDVVRQLGFTTVDEGLDLVEQAYPGRPIPGEGEVPPHRNRGVDAALKSTTGGRQKA